MMHPAGQAKGAVADKRFRLGRPAFRRFFNTGAVNGIKSMERSQAEKVSGGLFQSDFQRALIQSADADVFGGSLFFVEGLAVFQRVQHIGVFRSCFRV